MPIWIDSDANLTRQWLRYEGNAEGLKIGADVLLPVEVYAESRALWDGHASRIGVELGPVDDPMRLHPWLSALGLIAVSFGAFTDGRGFSIGRLVRSRLGWRGPLLATGVLLPDQVPMLARCGFDRFELVDEEVARQARRLLLEDPVHALLRGAGAGGRSSLPGSESRRTVPAG